MKRISSKRIALLGILTALALISFIIENLFPPLFVPGAKMGISNVFTLLAVVTLSPLDGIILVCVRTMLGCVLTGNLSSLMYSLSAGLVAVILSGAVYKLVFPKISLVAISVLSAVAHNLTQNLIYIAVTKTPEMISYFPYLALVGIFSGCVVGAVVTLALKKIPLEKIGFE